MIYDILRANVGNKLHGEAHVNRSDNTGISKVVLKPKCDNQGLFSFI